MDCVDMSGAHDGAERVACVCGGFMYMSFCELYNFLSHIIKLYRDPFSQTVNHHRLN